MTVIEKETERITGVIENIKTAAIDGTTYYLVVDIRSGAGKLCCQPYEQDYF